MTMRRGLAKSKNMISIRILQVDRPAVRAGVDHALRLRRRQAPGLPARWRSGAGSVTPLQMATAYSVFANGGYRINPLPDQPHHRLQGPACSTRRSVPVLDESMRTIDARNAFVMTSLLQEVTRTGTAAKAQAGAEAARHLRQDRHDQRLASTPGSPAGSRTSSPSSGSATTTPRKLGDRETGGGLALPVWIDYMTTRAARACRSRSRRRPKASST